MDQDDTKSTDHFEVRGLTCDEYLGINLPTEHPVNKLANIEIQTTPTGFQYWMEG